MLTIIFLILMTLFACILSVKKEKKPLVGDIFFNKPVADNPNFIEPCYVYEDGFETPLIRKKSAIIGYRLGPKLVIHDLSGKKRTDHFEKALFFARDFAGNFLNKEDLAVLKNNYAALNDLRLKVGQPRLPEGYFWLEGGKKTSIVDIPDDSDSLQTFYNVDNPFIILKR